MFISDVVDIKIIWYTNATGMKCKFTGCGLSVCPKTVLFLQILHESALDVTILAFCSGEVAFLLPFSPAIIYVNKIETIGWRFASQCTYRKHTSIRYFLITSIQYSTTCTENILVHFLKIKKIYFRQQLQQVLSYRKKQNLRRIELY